MKILGAVTGNKLSLGVGGWVWHWLEIWGELYLYFLTPLPLAPKSYLSLPSCIGCFFSSSLCLCPYQQNKLCPAPSWPSSKLSLQQEEEVQSPAVPLCQAVHAAAGYTWAPCKKFFLWVLPCRSAAAMAAAGDWKETGCSVGSKVTMGKGKGIPSLDTLPPFGKVASCMFWFWVMQNRGALISAV